MRVRKYLLFCLFVCVYEIKIYILFSQFLRKNCFKKHNNEKIDIYKNEK